MTEIPKELKSKVRKYALMVAWWNLHENDEDMVDKLREVLDKIEQTEEELRLSGLNDKTFDGILEKTKEFLSLNVGEMTDQQLETLVKLIFGQKVELTYLDEREYRKMGNIYFDPVKYAKELKKKKKEKSS
jgi:hypothetical protein